MVKTINPATGQVLEEYDMMSKDKVMTILKETHSNFQKWKDLSLKERGDYFTKLAAVLRDNKQEYAEMMTKEMGKPITESLGEVEKCAGLAEVLRDNAEE